MDSEPDHTAGIHRTISLIIGSVRKAPGWSIDTLEPDWRSTRHWRDLHRQRILQPDAMGMLKRPEGLMPFLLEYERRARHPSQGRARIGHYLDYYRHSGWRQHWNIRPVTLFVFEDAGSEATFLRTTGDLMGVNRIRTTCMQTLENAGALGYAWHVPGGDYELTRL